MKPINCMQIELFILDFNTWNHLTLCKQMIILNRIISINSNNWALLLTNYSLTSHLYNTYMYKLELTLNNPQRLFPSQLGQGAVEYINCISAEG